MNDRSYYSDVILIPPITLCDYGDCKEFAFKRVIVEIDGYPHPSYDEELLCQEHAQGAVDRMIARRMESCQQDSME